MLSCYIDMVLAFRIHLYMLLTISTTDGACDPGLQDVDIGVDAWPVFLPTFVSTAKTGGPN